MKTIADFATKLKSFFLPSREIAPVEEGENVIGDYSVGKQFMRNGNLYKAKVAITHGTLWSSLTFGTDYDASDNIINQMDNNLLTKVNDYDISPVEGTNFSRQYTSGQTFYHEGIRYSALRTINQNTAFSSLTLNTDYAVADNVSSQIQALTNNKVNVSDIANNLTTETAGKVLDATQGKALNDAITTQKANITNVNRTGTTNSGTLIPKGKYFYLDGALKIAKTDIANGATFTSSNTESGVIGDKIQANSNGTLVGYYATHTWQASEMSNVTSGSITVTNRNGVCCVKFTNVVCTANTVLLDASDYIGHVYDYDSDGSEIYIDNGRIYSRVANAGYRILTFVN